MTHIHLRLQSQKTDRHVFLLDGLTVCCRSKVKGGVKEKQYRLKEKINMRKVTLVDLQDSDGEWSALCVVSLKGNERQRCRMEGRVWSSR